MAEHIRDVKITVYIDTNKATYTEEFESMNSAVEYYGETLNHITCDDSRLEVVDMKLVDENIRELKAAVEAYDKAIPKGCLRCEEEARALLEVARKFVPE